MLHFKLIKRKLIYAELGNVLVIMSSQYLSKPTICHCTIFMCSTPTNFIFKLNGTGFNQLKGMQNFFQGTNAYCFRQAKHFGKCVL